MIAEKTALLPLRWQTPAEWARVALSDPIALLIDHAFLEKKAANNAMELLTRWPGDWLPGWVETMTSVARDETAHLAQVTRILIRRGGRLSRTHKNPYANSLRLLVRKGEQAELLDRLFVSALIEARSCERFGILADFDSDAEARDAELAAFYRALHSSELGHYKVFLKLARKIAPAEAVEKRWEEMLGAEVRILAAQEPGPRIHSGWPETPPIAETLLSRSLNPPPRLCSLSASQAHHPQTCPHQRETYEPNFHQTRRH